MCAAGEVHVWIVEFSLAAEVREHALSLLSADERERFQRLRVPEKGVQFAIARACLRTILSRYTGLARSELSLALNPHGKPFLPDSPWEFNVSHSGGVAAIAIANRARVGIDIEEARRPCDAAEDAKLREWTRRESCIKAQGLALPVENAVSDPGWGQWELSQLPSGYIGTLTAEGEGQIREVRLQSDACLERDSISPTFLDRTSYGDHPR
jgi:4'-phosphopantetheinyl transferase